MRKVTVLPVTPRTPPTPPERELLATVAHDLMNPINTILLNLGRPLGATPSDGEERRAFGRPQLQMIERAVRRMNRIVSDLIDYSSIDAAHLHVETSLRDVKDVLAVALEQMGPACDAKHIALVSSEAGPLPRIVADGDRLVQALSNLIGNAIRFTPEGGRITLGAKRSGRMVAFSVRDTGAGIASRDLPHVFAPFWTSRRDGAGIGLGLTITRGIVEAHGGEITLESELRVGTCVSFTVPAG